MEESLAGTLYDEVLGCCGLSQVLAVDVVERVCARAGLKAAALTRAQLMTAMPAFEKALKLYLGPMALRKALERLRALAGDGGGQPPPVAVKKATAP
jgi:hypothetical protein